MNNETIFIIIAIGIGVLSLILAFIAVQDKRLSVSVIAAGVVSLFASVLFLLMAAPDVAMTEAAIGSGLTTVVFLFALNSIRKGKEEPRDQ